jgi:hypothetical protein
MEEDGMWRKEIETKFDKAAWNIVGAKSMVEEVPIRSLDAIIIGQIEEKALSKKTTQSRQVLYA